MSYKTLLLWFLLAVVCAGGAFVIYSYYARIKQIQRAQKARAYDLIAKIDTFMEAYDLLNIKQITYRPDQIFYAKKILLDFKGFYYGVVELRSVLYQKEYWSGRNDLGFVEHVTRVGVETKLRELKDYMKEIDELQPPATDVSQVTTSTSPNNS